ncbi:MAG: SDR family oxidoreductase [Burkholderiaceae bacterium]
MVGAPRRILITGATGTLGRAIALVCGQRGLDCNLVGRREMDIANPRSVAAALAAYQPWAIINTAGYVRVPDAEREPERCFRENAEGAGILAEACASLGIPLVTFSSDLVFDGRLGRAYRESDSVCPATVYGASKARAERLVLETFPSSLVIRTSAFFGPWDIHNFAFAILRDLAAGRKVEANGAQTVSPTYVPDLAHAVLDLLIDGASGIWHLANRGSMTWRDFARELAQRGGFNPDLVLTSPAGVPTNNTLDSEHGPIMPTLEHGIDRFFHDSRESWRTAAAELRAAEG